MQSSVVFKLRSSKQNASIATPTPTPTRTPLPFPQQRQQLQPLQQRQPLQKPSTVMKTVNPTIPTSSPSVIRTNFTNFIKNVNTSKGGCSSCGGAK